MKTITVIFCISLIISIIVDFYLDVIRFKRDAKQLRREKDILESAAWNKANKAVFEKKSLEYKEKVGRNILHIIGTVFKAIIYTILLTLYILG